MIKQEQIRFTVTENTKDIEKLIKKGTFELNKEIARLREDIDACREECKHEFVNGICKWCDIPEEFVK